jgi:hypothetical protein
VAATPAAAATPAPAPAPGSVSSVTLQYNGLSEQLRLVNNRVSLPAIKEAFSLAVVKLDGVLEPCDQLGYTAAEFAPGQVVAVSGTPVAGAPCGWCR